MATQQAMASCGVSSEFWGSQGILRSNEVVKPLPSRKSGVVRMAISRKKKEETVEKTRQQLEGCMLVAGIKYTGLTVKHMQQLRKALPQETTLMVAKNKLIGKAIEGTEWEALKPALKGMNAWLFVHTEEIPSALKPYRDLQKELKLENDFTGAVFEGRFFTPEEFKVLESMPTRAELYGKLLGTIQAPAAALVGTLQAPARELVFTLKAYVKKLEDEA